MSEKYGKFSTGEVAGATSATIMPTVTCTMVMIKALASNAGNVYLGDSTVTVVDGTTDVTSGWELDAGEETGWIPLDNLNRLYRICNNSGDDVVYFAIG